MCDENAPISTFEFQSNKTHLLRLINTSGEGTQVFSIDDHVLTVIANDYIPIEPYEADYVILGPAQRADVIVKGTGGAKKSFYARSSVGPCDPIFHPHALAAVYYPGADKTEAPSTQSTITLDPSFCHNVRSLFSLTLDHID